MSDAPSKLALEEVSRTEVPRAEVPVHASIQNWVASLVRQAALVVWHLSWHALVFATWVLPPFWRGQHYFYLARRAWGPGLVWIGGSTARFEGRDKVDWTKPHVIIANHQGNADIPLLFMLVPTPLRFLAKRSVGRIPILGWMLRLAGFPFVDRDNARRGRDSIDETAERIRVERQNVVVFPEGTRSPEGYLLPFKAGAFSLAIKAQIPIVPVAIRGSGTVLARGSFRIYPSEMVVTVGDPIETTGLGPRDRKALTLRAEEALRTLLGWRRAEHHELDALRAADAERRYRTLVR